jgi:hypothetical protein
MTIPGDLPDAGADSRAADSAECFLVLASYQDSAKPLGRVTDAVTSRARMSLQHSDFFQFRLVDLGPPPSDFSPDPSAVNLIARELTSPRGDARNHYFAVLMLDHSAAVAEAVLDGCRAHPALSRLPARWLGLANTDDRAPGDHRSDELPPAQVVLAKAGSWTLESLFTELWRYVNQLLDDFSSGREASLTSQRLSDLHVLAVRVAEGRREGRGETHGIRPSDSRQAGSAADGDPASSLTRSGRQPVQGHPAPSSPQGPPSPPGPSRRRRRVRAVARFLGRFLGRLFRRLARAVRGSTGPQPRLTAAEGMVRLVLLVVVSDGGRPDPGENRHGWSLLVNVERELARVQAGFWVRPLAIPGHPRDLLHPAHLRARAERVPEGHGLDLASALETARMVLDQDITALQGGSWLVDRPAVVFYVSRVPLADPRTVRAYAELLAAFRPIVSWVVPPGSADLIAPQLRTGATISIERRGVATDVTRRLCDQLAAR